MEPVGPSNIISRPHMGKTIVLDSDFRLGALLYGFISAILFSYSVINIWAYNGVRLNPSTSLQTGQATALLVTSILISIVAGISFIYSLYKLIIVKEKRDEIYKQLVSFSQKPTGLLGRSNKIEPDDINNYFVAGSENQTRNINREEYNDIFDDIPNKNKLNVNESI